MDVENAFAAKGTLLVGRMPFRRVTDTLRRSAVCAGVLALLAKGGG